MDLAEYIEQLKRHDWHFEFSDDYSVWKRGHDVERLLLSAAKKLDPDYEFFNHYAPKACRRNPK